MNTYTWSHCITPDSVVVLLTQPRPPPTIYAGNTYLTFNLDLHIILMPSGSAARQGQQQSPGAITRGKASDEVRRQPRPPPSYAYFPGTTFVTACYEEACNEHAGQGIRGPPRRCFFPMLCRCSSHSSIAFSSSSGVFIVECFARVRSCSRCNRSVNLIRMRNISEVRPSVYIEHCEACTESGWQNWDPGGCICGG